MTTPTSVVYGHPIPDTPPVPFSVPAIPVPDPVLVDVEKGLTLLQRFVKADKTAVAAGLFHIAVLLTAYLGLKLSAQDVAIIGSLVSAGVTYFLGMHFKLAAQVPKK